MLDSESAPSLNPMTMWDAVCFFPSHTVCLSVPLQLNSYFRDADIGGGCCVHHSQLQVVHGLPEPLSVLDVSPTCS